MGLAHCGFNLAYTGSMNVKTIITSNWKWIVGGIILLLVIFFVFRHIKDIQAESKAERELLLRQRKEAEVRLEERHKEELRKSDSAYMELLGIKSKVEVRIIERTKYVEKFIDTASIRTMHKYMDSLFGPK